MTTNTEQRLFQKIANVEGIMYGLRHECNRLSKIYNYRDRLCINRDEYFTEWIYRLGYSMDKISINSLELIELNTEIDVHTAILNTLERKLRAYQQRYTNTDTFCIERFKVGTEIEWDYSSGGNSMGVMYRITKTTPTYIMAICLLNNKIRKITKPSQIRRINTL